MHHRLITLILLLASGVLGVAGTGCSANPATGRRQLNLIDEPQEIRIGDEATPQFLGANGGQVPSDELTTYVQGVGRDLADRSERPDLPWTFYVLNSPQINAFALPGGKVFMSRGLLEKMDNEAQLAGVLGHEIGHVTGKHINDRMTNQLLITGLAVGLGVAGAATDEDYLKVLGVGVGVGGTVYNLAFSRSQELEADELGVRYMTRAGYNPMGQVQVMEILEREAGSGGGGIFSTHPNPKQRVARLKHMIPRSYPDYSNADHYRLGRDRFQTHVLAVLADLPPPPGSFPPRAQRGLRFAPGSFPPRAQRGLRSAPGSLPHAAGVGRGSSVSVFLEPVLPGGIGARPPGAIRCGCHGPAGVLRLARYDAVLDGPSRPRADP